MKKTLFVFALISLLIAGCSKSSTTPDYTPNCSGTAKSFKTDVYPVFQNACQSCHGNFSGYAQIAADKSAIRSKIVSGSMPQGGSLSDTQKNNVVCWIDNGAPNN